MANLQVSLLGAVMTKYGNDRIRKRSVFWNLAKLNQLLWCNRGFRPSTTQNHLCTKQFMSGTKHSSRVAACVLKNEQASQDYQVCARNFCQKPPEVIFSYGVTSGIVYMCHLCHVIYDSWNKGSWRQSNCYRPWDVAMCVWQELDYRIDVCHVTKGGYIKHL
jgi:hypothetical protein